MNEHNNVPLGHAAHCPVRSLLVLGVAIHHFCCCGSLDFLRLLDGNGSSCSFWLSRSQFSDGRGPAISWFSRRCLSVPIFSCGLACSRFHIEKSGFFLVSSAVFVVAYAYAAAGMLGYIPFSARTSIAALLIGVTGSFIVLRSGWKNRALAFIGASSYAIFLFHVFFSASSRMFMHTLGIGMSACSSWWEPSPHSAVPSWSK